MSDARVPGQGPIAPAAVVLSGGFGGEHLPQVAEHLVRVMEVAAQFGFWSLGAFANRFDHRCPLREFVEPVRVKLIQGTLLLGLLEFALKRGKGFGKRRSRGLGCWLDVGVVGRLKGLCLPGVDFAQTLVELLGGKLLRAARVSV
jgi:hypothetical protein